MDRINHFRIFVRVAETGSFTQAADQLSLPRATVSAAVQALEARLGARLLHRTTRHVSLTQDGDLLLERARSLVADVEDLEQQFRPSDGLAAGRLKVDAPARITHRLIAPLLPDFFARYPSIELELGASDRVVDLVQERVDCALRVGPLANNSLVARPLGSFALINCASPAYLARHGTPASVSELGGHLAINYVSSSSGRLTPWEWQYNGTAHSMPMRSQVATSDSETSIACAIAGLGLLQVPEFDVREHIESGALLRVLPHAQPAPMEVHLVYPHRRHLPRRMQIFIGWLEALLAPYLDQKPGASRRGKASAEDRGAKGAPAVLAC